MLQNGDLAVSASIYANQGNIFESREDSIQILNPTDGSLKTTIHANQGRIWALLTLPNGNLVSGSDDYIKIWTINGDLLKSPSIKNIFVL